MVVNGPKLKNTILLPESAEQINESIWIVKNKTLTKVTPNFINRQVQGIITDNFEIEDGIVLGTVPGAKEGMSVTTTEPN